MLFEKALEGILSFFGMDSFSFDGNYISAFSTIIDYMDYFDMIVPVKTLIGCTLFLFVLTVICAIVKVVLMII